MMINKQLINPDSIVVVGGSANMHKPGGKILRNIVDGGFRGALYAVNNKEIDIPGVICYSDVSLLPETDLAIVAIPSQLCPSVIDILLREKRTKAFIIISSGFSETGAEGAALEKLIVSKINDADACLLGPNCIGILTEHHHSLFTSPIPRIDPKGCDLISSSGATAVFILESGMAKGLHFASVFSIGNGAQTSVEDVLQYLNENFHPGESSKIKLLYLESIKDPDSLLYHASSLIKKGCKIAAIKAGISQAGSRAASSHTGAIASSDLAVEALFRKAGIVRCFGREELTTVASIFVYKELKGKNFAIITHAGGPGVMLTDALTKGGLEIPEISGSDADEFGKKLLPGSSVQNPIDLLATGTAEHLDLAIDFCENKCNNIDAIAVIFGSPGLVNVFDAYSVLNKRILSCKKPIYPILPSLITAKEEVEHFIKQGHVNFPDEVMLGGALTKVFVTPKPAEELIVLNDAEINAIRKTIDSVDTGYMRSETIQELLRLTGIDIVNELVSDNKDLLLKATAKMGYPVVAKVVGPLHKSDIGGVALNIKTEKHLAVEFDHLMNLQGAIAVMVQPMLTGMELFIGAKYEPRFGHVIFCGLGGIFIEVLKDVSSGLAPLSYSETYSMIRSLKSYKIIKGTRGQSGINEEKFAEIIVRLSSMLRFATEIKELDLNPLIGSKNNVTVVDARVLVEK